MKLSPDDRAQLVETLRQARADDALPAVRVREIAASLGISPGYVYRLARVGVAPRTRGAWVLSERAIELYYDKRGRVPAVHAALVDGVEEVPSLRQLQRAFATQLDNDERAFVRWGAVARRARSGTVRWEARSRNAVWQTDHVKLGVPVAMVGHPRPRRLWMTYFVDCYSRMVMGWMVSVRESSDAVLEALRDAILLDPEAGSPQGGTPVLLMYDNGLTFVADVIQQAAALLGFRTQPVAPYSPHLNGKVERCHQTISALALSEMPAWKNGPRDKRGQLYGEQAIDEHTLIREVANAVRHYNFERPHSALGGETPWACFSADETALRVQERSRLRFALRHRKPHTVQASGVYKHGGYYWHDTLDSRVGDGVIVAWLRYDERTVDVYEPDGRFLCEAVRVSEMTPAQVLETKRAQRMRQAAQTKRMRKALSRAEERYAPTNQPDGLEIITRTAQDPAPERQTGDDAGLLERLGLTDGLNEPWEPGR
jgi:putative transposase